MRKISAANSSIASGRAWLDGSFAKFKIDSEVTSDHLQRTFFTGKNREAQNFLAIDHALDRGAAVAFGQGPVHFNQAANVIGVVLDRNR